MYHCQMLQSDVGIWNVAPRAWRIYGGGRFRDFSICVYPNDKSLKQTISNQKAAALVI